MAGSLAIAVWIVPLLMLAAMELPLGYLGINLLIGWFWLLSNHWARFCDRTKTTLHLARPPLDVLRPRKCFPEQGGISLSLSLSPRLEFPELITPSMGIVGRGSIQ